MTHDLLLAGGGGCGATAPAHRHVILMNEVTVVTLTHQGVRLMKAEEEGRG